MQELKLFVSVLDKLKFDPYLTLREEDSEMVIFRQKTWELPLFGSKSDKMKFYLLTLYLKLRVEGSLSFKNLIALVAQQPRELFGKVRFFFLKYSTKKKLMGNL